MEKKSFSSSENRDYATKTRAKIRNWKQKYNRIKEIASDFAARITVKQFEISISISLFSNHFDKRLNELENSDSDRVPFVLESRMIPRI